MSTTVLTIRVPADMKKRLDALSASTGRSQAFYVREAVAKHIDALEWAYGIATEAEGVRSGQVKRALHNMGCSLCLNPPVWRRLRVM